MSGLERIVRQEMDEKLRIARVPHSYVDPADVDKQPPTLFLLVVLSDNVLQELVGLDTLRFKFLNYMVMLQLLRRVQLMDEPKLTVMAAIFSETSIGTTMISVSDPFPGVSDKVSSQMGNFLLKWAEANPIVP